MSWCARRPWLWWCVNGAIRFTANGEYIKWKRNINNLLPIKTRPVVFAFDAFTVRIHGVLNHKYVTTDSFISAHPGRPETVACNLVDVRPVILWSGTHSVRTCNDWNYVTTHLFAPMDGGDGLVKTVRFYLFLQRWKIAVEIKSIRQQWPEHTKHSEFLARVERSKRQQFSQVRFNSISRFFL